jgi:hypothetical protein
MENSMNKTLMPFLVIFGLLALAAACTPLVNDPLATETSMPVEETDPHQSNGLCFVFISDQDELIGGKPQMMENFYLSKKGTFQHSQERNDDIILTLQHTQLDDSALILQFEQLPVFDQEITPTEPMDEDDEAAVVIEYYEPIILIEMGYCDGTSRRLIFNPDELPQAVSAVLAGVEALAASLPQETHSPNQAFIRSQKLPDVQAEQMLEDGLVTLIDQEILKTAPMIEEATNYERRLIPIEQENLYGSIPLSFSYGKSGHISWNEDVYQIRHLIFEYE